ncbi:hypothetical protein RIF29_28765 [Crotalaria pallida]|uniref:Uncharacterized protein n=1 Tax=Crotalaria pallida TaxID=3830 RepID=A0AAN9HZP4_CROPI
MVNTKHSETGERKKNKWLRDWNFHGLALISTFKFGVHDKATLLSTAISYSLLHFESIALLSDIPLLLLLLLLILMPQMLHSMVKLTTSLVCEPTSTLITILYYGNLLPRNLNLERFVRRDFLNQENYFFHFLTTMMRILINPHELWISLSWAYSL